MPLIRTESQVSYDEISVTKVKKIPKVDLPPYRLIGRAGVHKKIKGINTNDLFMGFSKKANWLFWLLDKQRDMATNTIILRSKSLTPAERKAVSIAFKELKNKDVVKRIKKEHYIINPKVMLPHPNKEYPKVWVEWESLP